jgi:hypothetical protein
VPAGSGSGAAPAPDVGGTWTEIGLERPTMTVADGTILVDMSAARRPDAVGTVLDATTIRVAFPDAGTFVGVLRTPTFIRWCNGVAWHKVFTGPQVLDLQGVWTHRNRPVAHVSGDDGRLRLDLSGPRPGLAVGFATGPATIRATFPGDVPRLGTLVTPNVVHWNDGTRWRRTAPVRVPFPFTPCD